MTYKKNLIIVKFQSGKKNIVNTISILEMMLYVYSNLRGRYHSNIKLKHTGVKNNISPTPLK